MLFAILYQVILVIGKSVLLGGFELGDEVLDVNGVDKKLQNADLMKTSCCMADMNS